MAVGNPPPGRLFESWQSSRQYFAPAQVVPCRPRAEVAIGGTPQA